MAPGELNGSLAAGAAVFRDAARLECVDVMDQTGSRDLKLWFADGTNYPGQDSIHARQERLAETLSAIRRKSCLSSMT